MTISTWSESMIEAVISAWQQIIIFMPKFFGAIVIILVGFLVAWLIKWLLEQFFTMIKLQTVSDQIKLTDLLKKINVSSNVAVLLGNLVYWLIVVVFLLPAFQTLGLDKVNDVLYSVLAYIPNALVAAFLVLVGILLADFVANLVKAAAAGIGATTAGVLSSLVRYAIIIFVVLAALVQLNIASYFLTTLFTGFVGMFAIAGGIAFGLGGKDAAKELVDKVKDDFTTKK